MNKTLFKGCATALITPINEKGVNFDALEKIIEFQIAKFGKCNCSMRHYG